MKSIEMKILGHLGKSQNDFRSIIHGSEFHAPMKCKRACDGQQTWSEKINRRRWLKNEPIQLWQSKLLKKTGPNPCLIWTLFSFPLVNIYKRAPCSIKSIDDTVCNGMSVFVNRNFARTTVTSELSQQASSWEWTNNMNKNATRVHGMRWDGDRNECRVW